MVRHGNTSHTLICSLGEFTKVGASVTNKFNDSTYKGNKKPVSLSKWSLYQDVNTIISAVKLNILTQCYEVYGDWLGFRASLQWSLEELQLLSLCA